MPRVSTKGISTGFAALPGGEYDANIFEHKEGTSKAGEDKHTVQWSVAEEGFEGRRLFSHYSLQAKALWKIKSDLLAIAGPEFEINGVPLADILEDEDGWDTTEVWDAVKEGIESGELMPARLKVTESEYNGKPSNDVEVIARTA
jgi:hypothetical protein